MGGGDGEEFFTGFGKSDVEAFFVLACAFTEVLEGEGGFT